MEEGRLEASSWEGKSGKGRQWSYPMGGRWGSLPLHVPPPAHRGVDESEGDFPGGNLSPSWPMQDRTRQLAEMLLAGDMIRLAVGVEGWCGV